MGFGTVGKDLRTLLLFGFLCNEQRLHARTDATAPGCCGSLSGLLLRQEPLRDAARGSRWAVYVEALIQSLQVRVHTEGLEKTPKEGRFLLVCNHLFIADPGILLHYFKDSQLAFITKKENQALPFVGPIMHKILCQPLDRENDRQALRSIINCINIIKQDKASIAVFPEGGTSKDGKLHHFRHGAFKIALKTKVPIVVCTIQGTRNILKNGLRLKPTDVRLHLVEVIGPEEYGAMTTVALGERIYQDMLDDLGADFVPNT